MATEKKFGLFYQENLDSIYETQEAAIVAANLLMVDGTWSKLPERENLIRWISDDSEVVEIRYATESALQEFDDWSSR